MKKIIYFVIMGITVYLNILYDWKEGALVLSAELVFLFFCLLESCFVRFKIKAQMTVKRELVEQGEDNPLSVEVENISVFPTVVRAKLFIRYAGEKKKTKQIWKIYAGGKKKEKITKNISVQKCGKMEIELEKITVSDWWGGFSFQKTIKEQEKILIMPKPFPVNLTISHKTKWFPIESEEYAKDRSGDDNTEIYEIREYRNGDHMQKVHWKVSAKQNDLYVKEYSYPLGAGVLVLLEGGKVEYGKKENTSLFLQGVVSLSVAMLYEKCSHYIAWQKKGEPFIQRRLIKDEESFYQFIPEFLEIQVDLLESDMEERYRYQYRNAVYSTKIIFTNTLELQINQQERLQINQGLEQFFETMEIIV